MSFFEHQHQARRATRILILYFVLAVIGIIFSTYALVTLLFTYAGIQGTFTPQGSFAAGSTELLFGVAAAVITVVCLGSAYKLLQLRKGGVAVAQSIGAVPVNPDTEDFDERRLLNIVEEISLASGVPVPSVFVMEEGAINAFAAGYAPDTAVVAVSRGALQMLKRDELQGVVAHEFSHILNGDMRLNIRLLGVIHGILVIALIGYELMRVVSRSGNRSRSSSRSSGGEKGGIAAILVLGLGLLVIGYIGVFFTRLIQSAVSRQREFLADASAVQFTRNPDGIAGALKKIGGYQRGSLVSASQAQELAHMFFSNPVRNFLARMSSLFATHPPLPIRIKRIDPSFSGEFQKVTLEEVEKEKAEEALKEPAPIATPLSAVPEMGSQTLGLGVPKNLHFALGLLSSVPLSLKQETRNAFGARALLIALVVSGQKTIPTETQFTALDGSLDEGTLILARKLFHSVQKIPAEVRLSFVHLTAPALGNMSSDQEKEFLQALNRLVKLDEQESLFEKLLLVHISGLIERRKSSSIEESLGRESLRRWAGACLELVWTISYYGHDTPEERERAFLRATKELKLTGPVSSTPSNTPSLEGIRESFRLVRNASLSVKERLCKALQVAAELNGQVSLAEAQILRASYAELGIPIPPTQAA